MNKKMSIFLRFFEKVKPFLTNFKKKSCKFESKMRRKKLQFPLQMDITLAIFNEISKFKVWQLAYDYYRMRIGAKTFTTIIPSPKNQLYFYVRER